MNVYTWQEACIALGIDEATLYRWCKKAGYNTPDRMKDPGDKRKRVLTESQIQALATLHKRQVQGISLAESRQVQDTSLADRLQDAMQSIEALVHRVDELEKQNAALREEVEALQAHLEAPAIVVEQKAPRRERAPKAETTPVSEGLPNGLVAWRNYAEAHNVPETTVGRSIKDKRLPVVHGPWKVGRVYVQDALDEAGHERFHELYIMRSDFTAPDDCAVCQQYALPPELADIQAFVELHTVSQNKVRELIGKGMIQVVKGTWKVGNHFIDRALDPKGRRDFWAQCHILDGFTSCDHCPH